MPISIGIAICGNTRWVLFSVSHFSGAMREESNQSGYLGSHVLLTPRVNVEPETSFILKQNFLRDIGFELLQATEQEASVRHATFADRSDPVRIVVSLGYGAVLLGWYRVL